jgi:sugar lactone lactonase YvrE
MRPARVVDVWTADPDDRGWADLDGGFPDDICLDAESAVWYGDVPNKRCARVREGGKVRRRSS